MAARSNSGLLSTIKKNPIAHLMLAVMYVCAGIIINSLQAASMVIWWSGNVDLYRTINIRLAYLHWAMITFLAEWWAGLKVTLFMRPEDFTKVNKESAIVVLNHKYDIDWVIGWVIGDRVKILGNAKCMAKQSLSYVPLMGWAWRFCEYIFVKRDLESDKRTILKALKNLAQFKHYFWMLIYCEGTRYTAKKHKQSMEVAEKKGLKPLKHHLLPRTKGFRMLTHGLRDSVSAVYDCTMYVKDNKYPTLLDLLRGNSFEVLFNVTRIPLKKVPDDDEGCAEFLHNLYQDKDADFDYCTEHNFFAHSGKDVPDRLKGFVAVDCPRRPECLLIVTSWAFLLLTPLLYYIWSLIVSGAWLQIAVMAMVLAVVSFVFHKILAQGAVSSSSSSYGSAKKTS